MKRVVPEFSDVVISRYLSRWKAINEFKRLWGTTTINGVEVLRHRRKVYPKMEDSGIAQLTKQLGLYEQFQTSQDGIKAVYLRLLKDKGAAVFTADEKPELADNLIKAIPEKANPDKSFITGTLYISGKFEKSKANRVRDVEELPITSSIANIPALKAEILSNFESYWADGYTIGSPDYDPYRNLIFMYALRDPFVNVEVLDIKRTKESVMVVSARRVKSVSVYQYALNIKVKRLNSGLAHNMAEMIRSTHQQDNAASKLVRQILLSYFVEPVEDMDPDWPDYLTVEKLNPSSDWIRHDGEYWLKTSYFSSDVPLEDKVDYLYSLLDVKTVKKKVKWYNKVAAVVIIIAAFVFLGPAGGYAASLAGASLWAGAVLIATAVVTVALVVTVIALAGKYIGMADVSTALGGYLRQADPLIKVAGVIALIGAIQNAAQEALARAGTEATASTLAKTAVQIAVEQMTGINLATKSAFANSLHMTNFVVGEYGKYESKKHNRKMKVMRKELQELQEAQEQSMLSDVLKDFIRIQPQVLAADHSEYADQYDRPYEPWQTTYHTGNIQANSINALWLSV